MVNLNTVHLNGLRAVEVVARRGSLQAAADELGVTVGAVSQQVAKTEAQIGRTLFERTPRGLVPTEISAAFLMRLSEGFSRLEEALRLVRQRDDRVLTISVAPVFAARWLVHRLDRFTKAHPNIRMRIDATMDLVNPDTSDIDVAIRVGAGQWPDVRAELLLPQRVFPICSPAMATRLASPADLLACEAVIDARAMFTWDLWLQAAGLGGAALPVRHSFNDASLCLDAAIAGQGVMLAWRTLAGDALAEGRLVAPFDLSVPTGFGHYFITSVTRRESPAVRAFKAWVRAELGVEAVL